MAQGVGRPPHSRFGPRKPSRRNPWIAAAIAVGILWGLAALGIMVFRDRGDRGPRHEDVAELFVQRIGLANGYVKGSGAKPEDAPVTGLRAAWDMLMPEKQLDVPFDVFVEDWTKLFDARGFVRDVRFASKRSGNRKWPRGFVLGYTLLLGNENSRHDELGALLLEVNLVRDDKSYKIADYAVSDTVNPAAK